MPRRARLDLPPPRPQALAFLRAIKETPDEDTPRLVFADWLEEQGDPCGDFLRLQCALARLDRGDPAREPLAVRERELQKRHAAEWLGPLRGLAAKWEFRRGLVRITLTARRFVSAPFRRWTTTEAYAWVDRLSVGVGPATVAKLVAAPYLGDISTLDLGGEIRNAGAAVLAASAHLARLISLNLTRNDIREAGAAALAASPHLARLSSLNLRRNAIGAAGARALRRRFGDRVALNSQWGRGRS
jgi:uncharacterized protein (TIGR02996 family)